MSSSFCGIDFGTSNSTVAITQDDKVVLCPLEDQWQTIPSAIFFNHEELLTHFGRDAVGLYTRGIEGRLLRSLKSILGTSLLDEITEIQGRGTPLRDVISLFFGHLKSLAERQYDRPLESVVVGRPVRFVDDDDKADRLAQEALVQIAREQGFVHVETQLEPVAAALAYEQNLHRDKLALVVDLGGGTSDFAIVKLSPANSAKPDRSRDILACTGVHIGGTDMDRDLSLDRVMPELGLDTQIEPRGLPMPTSYYHDLATWHRVTLLYQRRILSELETLLPQVKERRLLERLLEIINGRKGHQLAAEVEAAKIELSQSDPVQLLLPLNERVEVSISLAELNAVVQPRARALVAAIRECCSQAGVQPTQIDTVFLTGGTSMIPVIRSRILEALPGVHVVEGDVFGSVGLGLGIDAARRFGSFH